MNPETAPCINGPKLAAWLRERDRLPLEFGARRRKGDPLESLFRRVEKWSKGEQASIQVADRWLTFIGCHLSELPDDFFEDRCCRPRRANPLRKRGIQLVQDGLDPQEVAEGLGVSRRTIGRWLEAA